MRGFYQAFRVIWMPSPTLSEATAQPVIVAPVFIPTLFAALTSLVVYFKFQPADSTLRGVWMTGLVFSVLGPAVAVVVVSGLFFAICSCFGRSRSYRSFLSVTALGFVPTAFYHLAQGIVLLGAGSPGMPSVQVGRLSLARFLDSDSVSADLFVGASMIDVVSIWVIVLLVVGYRLLGGDSSPRLGPAVVIGGWVVYAALRITLAGTLTF